MAGIGNVPFCWDENRKKIFATSNHVEIKHTNPIFQLDFYFQFSIQKLLRIKVSKSRNELRFQVVPST